MKHQKPVVKPTYKHSYCRKIKVNLRILCIKETGMTLKILMVSVKHINTFSIYILKIEDSNKAYKYFLGIFIGIYD